jgi:methyl-accepting chemotaxis protein
MGFAVIAGIFITVTLSRSISNPVKQGLDFARKLEDGDFTERINIDQNDELGMLSNALNKAADKLEHTVTEIINSSNNLAQAVEQIASGNQNLSQRTSEQASALEEVAATIEEANSSINQNYENSLQASKMSETSAGIAMNGGELVGEAVQSINEVNSSAKRISEITTVINEIAFQTNLLALNAAVEAARAGEQGRGFAVVAGEVRNLAQRAGNAAKEIAQLIHDTVTKVENGTEKTYKSGESLKEIIESVKKVALVVGEIAAASNEQKQGVEQITTAITDLDSMTQHNAALVEETASASEEMANQAQELMSLMSQFKIRDELKDTARQQKVNKSVIMKTDISNGNGKKKNAVPPKGNTPGHLENEGYELF